MRGWAAVEVKKRVTKDKWRGKIYKNLKINGNKGEEKFFKKSRYFKAGILKEKCQVENKIICLNLGLLS